MKQIILSLSAIALLVNCTNSKSISENPTAEKNNQNDQAKFVSNDVVQQEITPYLIDSTVIDIDCTVFHPPIVGPGTITIPDSLWTVIPPDGGWGQWPPYEPWPITIIDWGTICIYIPDTLEENRVIPKDYFTSGKNCYSITPNEKGAIFEMEVVEEEIVDLGLRQFGDCSSHLPLNLSWANTPMQMRKGTKSIQLNYPKHYELDLQIDFIGELGLQSIQIQS